MSSFEYSMIYVLSWWMLLLMILPFRPQVTELPDAVTYPASPKRTYIKKKLIITTVLAIPTTFAVAAIITSGWFG